MKRSGSSKRRRTHFDSDSDSNSDFLTEDEIRVSEILVNLGLLIAVSELSSRFAGGWGGNRRRRSSLDAVPAFYPPPPPPPQPPLAPPTDQNDEIEEEKPQVKEEVAAESPSTPLAFVPSEPDDKSHKKTSKKRKREEYVEIIEELTRSRELLKGEVKNVRNYYNKLKAYNLELKAKKQELLNKGKDQGLDLIQRYNIKFLPHQQQLTIGRTVQIREKIQYPYVPMYSSSRGLAKSINVGPTLGIPDLNVSTEETFGVGSSQPLDITRVLADQRARFAENRRIRRGIIKSKNSNRSR